jgi:hypothetical protein
MVDIKQIQQTIRNIVDVYKANKYNEYVWVVAALKVERDKQLNNGRVEKGLELLERQLFQLPESLFSLFVGKLNKEEMEYFNSREGSMWFAKEFNQFSLVERNRI